MSKSWYQNIWAVYRWRVTIVSWKINFITVNSRSREAVGSYKTWSQNQVAVVRGRPHARPTVSHSGLCFIVVNVVVLRMRNLLHSWSFLFSAFRSSFQFSAFRSSFQLSVFRFIRFHLPIGMYWTFLLMIFKMNKLYFCSVGAYYTESSW